MGTTIKCTCGEKSCPIKIATTDEGLALVGKDGEVSLMYLDANAIVSMIRALHSVLLQRLKKAVTTSEELI